MAEVYRARLDRLDVAIKRLLPRYNDDDEFIVMLTDEARIIARFDHPNIVRLFEFGLVDDQHFLAMEFVDGVDLRSLLRRLRERGHRASAPAMGWVLEQALWGLDAAHEATDEAGRALEVVHRDFSPSNILVGYDGTVKLTDFGIAKARMNKARTRGGMIKGKVKYMSPEQTEGRRLGPASDVFAAGVVLHQALTGRMPFEAATDAELMWAIRTAIPSPASQHRDDLDEQFDAILSTALEKRPDDRHATAADFARALRAWRRATWPRFEPEDLGAIVQRCFAQERADASRAMVEVQHQDADDTSGHARSTSAHTQYTRLVEAAWATGSWPIDPNVQVDAWLAARRTGTRDEMPALLSGPTGGEASATAETARSKRRQHPSAETRFVEALAPDGPPTRTSAAAMDPESIDRPWVSDEADGKHPHTAVSFELAPASALAAFDGDRPSPQVCAASAPPEAAGGVETLGEGSALTGLVGGASAVVAGPGCTVTGKGELEEASAAPLAPNPAEGAHDGVAAAVAGSMATGAAANRPNAGVGDRAAEGRALVAAVADEGVFDSDRPAGS